MRILERTALNSNEENPLIGAIFFLIKFHSLYFQQLCQGKSDQLSCIMLTLVILIINSKKHFKICGTHKSHIYSSILFCRASESIFDMKNNLFYYCVPSWQLLALGILYTWKSHSIHTFLQQLLQWGRWKGQIQRFSHTSASNQTT